MQLSVLLTSKDSQEHIGDVLSSLQWVDEILLVDLASTDHTLAIAKGFTNVLIHSATAQTLEFIKKRVISSARHEWIFTLENCEILSKELAQELQELTANPTKTYHVPIHFFFHGQAMRYGLLRPKWQARLYHRHHDNIPGQKTFLKHPIFSYAFSSLEQLINSTPLNVPLEKKKKCSLIKALFAKKWAFINHYFLQRAFLEGSRGLILSFVAADKTFYQLLKTQEAQNNILCLDINDPADEE